MAFKVPEMYRLRESPQLIDMSRLPVTEPGDRFGMFLAPSPEPGWMLFVIATDGHDPSLPESEPGWEHVSVSARKVPSGKPRTPTWKEMCAIKDLFWDLEDVCFQLHPRRSKYVNHHENVLHIWRNERAPVPEPPAYFVG